ncbi:low molecular weight protein-tyrosine-phosphatase [Cyclobacterium jeungdonense]|uniref:protein-tyrosine-phosphatase n=2 Tax=Cyclobacterium jeungdonense TaxID=708087 RepID=A0ABT8CB19_9BACT|nr:low molecular weight protein-tyrosine-phosphatase [Cyclobacterium jeungdonense]MDN3688998.1 low molecular weight protein-tyrosine-phosphatase [Cyclobacterium jeungdonense]
MIKVLFVCLGNICRSPLAEALFSHKICHKGYREQVFADSCGTSDYHIGELPDERAMNCARRNGIEMDHRGRQLHRTDFRNFDYLIAMDQSNLENIMQLSQKVGIPAKNLHLMREFQLAPEFLEVPDPYYGGEDGFQKVFEILDEALDGFIGELEKNHRLNGIS